MPTTSWRTGISLFEVAHRWAIAPGCFAGWSGGIALASWLAPAQPLVGALALIAATLGLLLAVVTRPAMPLLIGAAGLAGMVRGEMAPADPGSARWVTGLVGRPVGVTGVVQGSPQSTAVGVEAVVAPDQAVVSGGRLPPVGWFLVETRAVMPEAGDRVRVSGVFGLPHDRPDFNRRAYLAQKHVHLEIRLARMEVVDPGSAAGLWGLPARLGALYQAGVTRLLPQPEAGLLAGVVLGSRAGIPTRLRQDLIVTGLVHLLVLSGLKVAIFGRLVAGTLRRPLGRWATWPAMMLIAVYCLAGGATAAAVRASIMGALALLAGRIGRPTHVWTALAATAAAMLGWDPSLVWDAGFQLSFVGTAAIILFTPVFERRLAWMPGLVREPFAVTCAAQAGTLPLIASGFHLISPVAPVANALVLPLLPAIVASGIVLVPLALVPDVGRWVIVPLAASLEYVAQVGHWLARIPGASLSVPSAQGWGLAYYSGLAAAWIATWTGGKARTSALVVTLSAMTLISGFEVWGWAHPPPRAVVLDVGRGQAVLLQSPSGSLLIDGGPDPARLAGEVGAYLPPWQRELTGAVITGPGQGHVAGLDGFGYRVGDLFEPEGEQPGTAWRAIALSMLTRGAHLHLLHAGMWFRSAGFLIQALAPEPAAPLAGQLALRVRGPSSSFCDLADLDADQQQEVAARLDGDCGTVLLPRGGSVTPQLLAAFKTSRLLLSDAPGDSVSSHLPPASLSRTSQEGDIEAPL